MKKIIAIIGSPRKNGSNTKTVVQKLFKELDEITNIKFDREIIELSKCTVNMCKGCNRCFELCKICDQFNDDIKMIEKKILESDIIILASPVFAHNIPAVMKNLIDRLSYGLHIMRFAGKYGITISVSSSNGNKCVNDYLSEMLMYFGVKVIDKLSVQMVKGIENEKLVLCAKNIKAILEEREVRKATDYENYVFQVMKKVFIQLYEKVHTKEAQYWMSNGLFLCNNFDDLFNK